LTAHFTSRPDDNNRKIASGGNPTAVPVNSWRPAIPESTSGGNRRSAAACDLKRELRIRRIRDGFAAGELALSEEEAWQSHEKVFSRQGEFALKENASSNLEAERRARPEPYVALPE
jgi:hypothetical protein